MNKTPIIILHGIEGHAGMHWEKWLHDKFTALGHKVYMPDLPDAGHPDRTVWHRTVEKILEAETEITMVGHSLGVLTALDVVSASPRRVKAFVSVSGFCSDYGVPFNSYFIRERTIDFSKVLPKILNSRVFYGDNDPYVPQEKLMELAYKLGVAPFIVHQGGHLNTDAGFTEFPLLFEKMKEIA